MLLLNPEHFTLHSNDRLTLRVKPEYDYSFSVPNYVPHDFKFGYPLAAIIHIYYTDVTDEIVGYIENIPTQTDLFISTDSEEKRIEIIDKLQNYTNGKICIRVFENRGRDIAPTFVGFRDVFYEYKYFIHIHTKKSLHSNGLDIWRKYLFETLLGSPYIVESILWQLSQPEIGIVFPQHFESISNFVNCCVLDYEILKKLLLKSGIDIDEYNYIDFPSSSMFFGRSDAIRILLEQNLAWDDFAEESNQVGGTLAHAVERSILFFAEKSGYHWIKISRKDLILNQNNSLSYNSPAEFTDAVGRVFIPVLCKYFNLFSQIVFNELNQARNELSKAKYELNQTNKRYSKIKQQFQFVKLITKKCINGIARNKIILKLSH